MARRGPVIKMNMPPPEGVTYNSAGVLSRGVGVLLTAEAKLPNVWFARTRVTHAAGVSFPRGIAKAHCACRSGPLSA